MRWDFAESLAGEPLDQTAGDGSAEQNIPDGPDEAAGGEPNFFPPQPNQAVALLELKGPEPRAAPRR